MVTSRFERYRARAQQFGAWTVLFQRAAAERLRLTPTELEVFRLLQHEAVGTAAELARQTGLTPASMSAVVDKLVGRGFVSRDQDRTDRRRWLLTVAPAAVEQVDALYDGHAGRVELLLAEYSEEELEVILDFLRLLADELKATAVELGRR